MYLELLLEYGRISLLAIPSFILLYLSSESTDSLEKLSYITGAILVFTGMFLDYITTKLAYNLTSGEEANPLMNEALSNSLFYEAQLMSGILISIFIVGVIKLYSKDDFNLQFEVLSSLWLIAITIATIGVILSNIRVILTGTGVL